MSRKFPAPFFDKLFYKEALQQPQECTTSQSQLDCSPTIKIQESYQPSLRQNYPDKQMKSSENQRPSGPLLNQQKKTAANTPPTNQSTPSDSPDACSTSQEGSKSSEECQFISNRGKICKEQEMKKNSKLTQFLQYVMKFKLGKTGSFQKEEKIDDAKQIKNPKSVVDKVLEKGYENSKIHLGYLCDKCEMNPIVGNRHHCSELECKDNFDLCESCYSRQGHFHPLQKIVENGSRHFAQSLSMIVTPKAKKKPFCPYDHIEQSETANSSI